MVAADSAVMSHMDLSEGISATQSQAGTGCHEASGTSCAIFKSRDVGCHLGSALAGFYLGPLVWQLF